MKNKKLFLLVSFVFISVSWISKGFSLSKPTHQYINQNIAQRTINDFSLDSYLINNLGFNAGVQQPLFGYSEVLKVEKQQEVWRWVGEGGIKEDEPEGTPRQIVGRARNQNHFHNPLEPWDQAGLHVFPYSWQSSIVWAQDPDQSPGGRWSWHDARNYFYQGLTLTNKNQRDSAMANCFRALGQLMHLVQDASVPAHVRDDVHILYMYEDWVEDIRTSKSDEDRRIFANFIANPISFNPSILNGNPNPLAPIPIAKIIDTGKYHDGRNPSDTAGTAIGIAEYTNANFFSEDTVFSNAFPYPGPTNARIEPYIIPDPRDSSKTVIRKYFYKYDDGATGYRLATVGMLKEYIMNHFPFYRGRERNSLDEGVYEDYAQKLIPRAVGYSAGLLKYFFRGELQVTAVPIVYKNGIQYLRLKIKNKTPTQETMKEGHFVLTYRYTPTGGKEDGSEDKFGLGWNNYPDAAEALNDQLKYADDKQKPGDQDEKVIDFLIPDLIPLETLKSVKFTLAFKGNLGKYVGDKFETYESDAVIGKVLTLGEIKFEEEWDNGLNGNHTWAHTDFNLFDQNPANGSTSNIIVGDSLVKDNIRNAGYRTALFNGSFVSTRYNNGEFKDKLPIKITPDTYIEFKIDEMWINQIPPAPPGYTNHWQCLMLRFNNGLGIQYFTQGQGLGLGPNVVYVEFDLNLITVDNIYQLFKRAEIPIPAGDMYLEEIKFVQQLFDLDHPSEVEHHQHMKIDSIRIVEGKQQ